jgi:hypothetical protein
MWVELYPCRFLLRVSRHAAKLLNMKTTLSDRQIETIRALRGDPNAVAHMASLVALRRRGFADDRGATPAGLDALAAYERAASAARHQAEREARTLHAAERLGVAPGPNPYLRAALSDFTTVELEGLLLEAKDLDAEIVSGEIARRAAGEALDTHVVTLRGILVRHGWNPAAADELAAAGMGAEELAYRAAGLAGLTLAESHRVGLAS